MKPIENTADYTQELKRLYDRLNSHFWNGELPDVIITLKPTRTSFGHITSDKPWLSGDGKMARRELNISSMSLDRDPVEICSTLLHEQCHLYCMVSGISDTSNVGRYHNKNFRRIAQDHGFNVEYDKRTGWGVTTFDPSALAYVKSLHPRQFAMKFNFRPSKTSIVRFACPKCSRTVCWSNKNSNLMCGNCKISLVETPAKDIVE